MAADRFATAAEVRTALSRIASSDIVTMMRAIDWNPERDFAGGDWRGIDFSGLDLRGFDFRNCRLHRSHFRGAQVAGADFRGADISQSTLYLAKGWDVACLDVDQREEVRELAANVSPDVGEYVRRILLAPTFEAGHAVYREMIRAGLAANKYALTALMDQAEVPAQAERVFDLFDEAGVEIDAVALNTLMKEMISYIDRCAIFEAFKSRGVERDAFSFNILLDAPGNTEKAYWLGLMRKSGLAPDRITYNILIRQAGSFEEALDYLDVAEAEGVRLLVVDYDALIRKADRDPNKVRYALERLLDAGLQPASSTFNAVLSEARDPSEAWSAIATMRAFFGLQPDIYSAFALVGVSETLGQAIEQVARLAAMGVHVVVNDVVKLILRTEQGEDRKRAIELCHLGGVRLTPELALRNLIGAFVPEARRPAMLTDLFGTPR